MKTFKDDTYWKRRGIAAAARSEHRRLGELIPLFEKVNPMVLNRAATVLGSFAATWLFDCEPLLSSRDQPRLAPLQMALSPSGMFRVLADLDLIDRVANERAESAVWRATHLPENLTQPKKRKYTRREPLTPLPVAPSQTGSVEATNSGASENAAAAPRETS